MASGDDKNWVTFEEEIFNQNNNEIKESNPWPTPRMDVKETSDSLSGSFSSTSSGSSFMSVLASGSRGTSPVDTSKYLPFKELEEHHIEEKETTLPNTITSPTPLLTASTLYFPA
eukprot:TRINITY_DN12926_c0_g1_i1.p2 TRINITY_DN12926_c0_g1~~TRINITY_DN12926_c0_g1_i1.p2  ORF type:complete len:135 (-),score=40.17 TRINITY_DN12926_c0_g1_i1:110-454(-)